MAVPRRLGPSGGGRKKRLPDEKELRVQNKQALINHVNLVINIKISEKKS